MSVTWFPELAEGETTLDRVVNHRPAYAAAMRDVEAAIWAQDVLEPEILEVCRQRIAQLLGSEERADGVHATRAFTDRERTCLDFAEQVLIDAQGVTDDEAARVIESVGEGGFLVLLYACGFFETTERARILLAAGKPR